MPTLKKFICPMPGHYDPKQAVRLWTAIAENEMSLTSFSNVKGF